MRRAAPAAPPPPADDGDLNNDESLLGGGLGEDGLIGKKRTRVPRQTFKESNLLSYKGMWLLYDEMAKLPLSRTPGREVSLFGVARSF